jgi:hypothetical protein
VIKIIDNYIKKPGYFVEKIVISIVPYLNIDSIEKVRYWAKENGADLEGSRFFVFLIQKAVSENNDVFLKKVCSDIFKFQITAKHFYSSHLVKDLNSIEFSGKKRLIQKLLLVGICKHAGDSYALSGLFSDSSEAIDENYPELKQYSYPVWKQVVTHSIKLSLSK